MAIERQTYKGQAYREIRQMLVEGELAPGAKVVVRLLSERLALSPTPIKSALAGLERDGFLVAVPHRGYFVPEVAVEDMREIYELREALDGIAARNAAGAKDAEEFVRRTLRPLYEEQRRLLDEHGGEGYSAVDVAFHRAIWHASGNARLAGILDNLGGQLRFASGSSSRVPGRVPEALQEHEAIMAALAAGDSALAERLSREHVRRAAEAFGGVVTPGSPTPYRPAG
ncbi:GntR family transcriptional regulator [Streptomyces sp. 8L]|uniref:GntR family transcriptional regulator n=1 Tax=Streptomyces sp. 8L TaxID=2877242 RepID=UPI001CD39077|nr:GntR family transcriptional regulator [Streptomyces sp. 8L]MCA1222539.1 GntR family transcriptional regulator [Streptomyces sp. 8L]